MQSIAGLASHSYWFAIRRLFAIILVAYAGGCATVIKIPRDQEVDLRIVWLSAPSERIAINNKAIITDASVGASGGGLLGAGAAGLACGPWAPFCMPFTAFAGMLVGGVAGAGVGILESWDREQIELLNLRFKAHLGKYDPQTQLKQALQARAQAHWRLAKGPGATVVRVEMHDFSFHTFRAGQGALYAKAIVNSEVPDSGKRWPANFKIHHFYGPTLTAAAWLKLSDEELEVQFDLMYRRIAELILADFSSG